MKTTIINAFLIFLSVSLFGQYNNTTVEGNSKFAFELYKKLKDEKQNENLFFSPFSISSALAMTYTGARNETQIEMSKTLHFALEQNKLDADFSLLLNKMTFKQEGMQLSIANSLWAQKDYKFLGDYFNLLKKKYNAGIDYVDFIEDTNREKARLKINEWVENRTNNKIKDILKPKMLDANSRLVLVNAMYFWGEWEIHFKKELTKQESFYSISNEKVETLFMNNTLNLKYFEDDKTQAIDIPYKNNKLSMIIILPKTNSGMNDLDKIIDYDNYLKILKTLKYESVDLSIPKFKITNEFPLKETLKSISMKISFSNYADFSGMTGRKDFKIDNVIHKAFVDVSEEGTEAAAATAVIMTKSSSMPLIKNKIFKADHPFLFLIKDNETESILFIGKILNPIL